MRIWKQQRISEALNVLLASLMVQIETYIKANAPGSLYGEWAKKESCWQAVSRQKFNIDISTIQTDLIDPANPPIRKSLTNDDAENLQQQNNANWLCTVPAIVWDQISEWGRLSTRLTFHQQQIATDIARRIRQYGEKARLTGIEINSGVHILEVVMEHASQLLENMPDDTSPVPVAGPSDEKTSPPSISLEEIQKAVAWDKRHKVLEIRNHVQLKEIAEGRKKLNTYNMPSVNYLIKKLTSRGFNSDI